MFVRGKNKRDEVSASSFFIVYSTQILAFWHTSKMNIAGKITGLKYKILLSDDLKEIDVEYLDINEMPSACLLTDDTHVFSVSKWVSPKRTRSCPFERVFNTLNVSKKITVIPIVKDEGASVSLESNSQDDKKSTKISGRQKQSGEIDFHAHPGV